MKSRFAVLSAAPLLSLLMLGSASQAQTVPPARPSAPYIVEFTWEKQEAGTVEKGRRRISVDGDKAREEAVPTRKDEIVDARVRIFDRKAATVIVFDPTDASKRFKTSPIGDEANPMAEGYEPIQKLAGKPIPVGGGQVAGNKCTALAWGADNIGRPTGDRQILCVADDGIVLSLERRAGSGSAKLNAVKLSREQPGPDLFAPPAGFTPDR